MFNYLKANEVALLLHGLRAVYVADEEKTRAKLVKKLEEALARKGVSLPE